jgi:hypothetical protein
MPTDQLIPLLQRKLKKSKRLDTETIPNHNANILLMYKKSIWQESCHINFSNTLEELAVTMCFIQKKKTIWQESCHIDSSRIFKTEKKDVCRRLVQNKKSISLYPILGRNSLVPDLAITCVLLY